MVNSTRPISRKRGYVVRFGDFTAISREGQRNIKCVPSAFNIVKLINEVITVADEAIAYHRRLAR
jgi:hypothetical protein